MRTLCNDTEFKDTCTDTGFKDTCDDTECNVTECEVTEGEVTQCDPAAGEKENLLEVVITKTSPLSTTTHRDDTHVPTY